jgi:hypothetical protein
MGWGRSTSPGSGRPLLVAVALFVASHLAPVATDAAALAAPPVGLYGVPAAACSIAATAGFSVVQNYDLEVGSYADSAAFVAAARAYLDAAARSSLQVLVGVPRAWLRERRETELRQVIRSLRAHPAVLGWYEDEIAEGGDLASVQFLSEVVGAEDPLHGLIIEEGNSDRRLLGIGRARMFTYYPVTESNRNAGRLPTLPQRLAVDSLRTPFWPVLQAFGRDLITGPAVHNLLAPRSDELRFSLCSALVHGAQGIFFYPYMHATIYSAQKAAAGQFAYTGYRPLPEVAPQLWKSVCENAALARRLLELVRDAAPAEGLKLAGVPSAVEWRAWQTTQGVLVVIANPVFVPCTVQIRLDAGIRGAWLLGTGTGDRTSPVVSGQVTVDVPGPGGVVLRFETAR